VRHVENAGAREEVRKIQLQHIAITRSNGTHHPKSNRRKRQADVSSVVPSPPIGTAIAATAEPLTATMLISTACLPNQPMVSYSHVRPVDLRLLADEGIEAQESFALRNGTDGLDESTQRPRAALIATVAQHVAKPGRTKARVPTQCLSWMKSMYGATAAGGSLLVALFCRCPDPR